MATLTNESKRAKYNKEIEEIKQLHDLNKILKAGDVENALLSSATSDSEIMSDTVMDSLLEQADKEARAGSKGLQVIAKLTTTTPSGKRVIRAKKVRKSPVRSKSKSAKKRKHRR
jgi:hypothetical protein